MAVARRSIVAAVEAVMVVVVMVVMSAIPGRHDHPRIVAVMMSIKAVVVMMMMMMMVVMVVMVVELGQLDVLRRSWCGSSTACSSATAFGIGSSRVAVKKIRDQIGQRMAAARAVMRPQTSPRFSTSG
jgi:uncharacterized membrane protein